MKRFGTVFAFEAKSFLRKKSFLITTLVLMLIFFGVWFAPRIISLFNSDPPAEDAVRSDAEGFVLLSDDFTREEFIEKGYIFYPDEEAMRKDLEEKKLSSGFVIRGLHAFDVLFQDRQLGNVQFEQDFAVLRENRILEKMNVDTESYRQLVDVPVQKNYTVLGTDGFSNYPITYIFIFIFYFLVIFYGNVISTSVAREKSDRTMELLITSTDTNSLLFGKVLGAGVIGVLQFSLLIVSALAGYFLNKDAFGIDISQFVQVGTKELVYFILFTIIGYFLFLFLYAGLGSAVSKVEDVSSSTTPITLTLVAVYMVAVFGMSMPDRTFFKIASFIPFSSPMIMPSRANLTSVPDIQVMISLGILILTSVFLGVFAARIYRMGTLNYGNRLSFKRMFKGLLKNQ
ncbi:MAG TPA: ABC transporter permease [Tissierellia bacterium]|nr:ABC transporter permease [Tissierellia bacterium]